MSIVESPRQNQRIVGQPSIIPGDSPQPVVTPPPPSGQRSNKQRAILAAGALLTMVLIAIAALLAEGLRVSNGVTPEQPIEQLAPVPTSGPSNWLFVGSDSRDGLDANDPQAGYFTDGDFPAGQRTDTMIIARIDEDLGTIEMLPVPRDLWVEIDGAGRSGRVNSAFASDNGMERLIATISNNLDIEIHHYAEVNFAGFQDIIDALGGVQMWFDTPMRDYGSGLDVKIPGCVTLDGSQALAFARGRTIEFQRADGSWVQDTSGDLGRITRQQHFLKQVVASLANVELTDVSTITSLLASVEGNFFWSDTREVSELADLAAKFKDFSGEEITSHSLPVVNFRTESGAAVLAMQPAEADQILAVFRGEEPPVYVPEEAAVTLTILNGSRVPGQAKSVQSALVLAAGFDVEEIANGPTTEETTLIYGPGFAAAASRVARFLEVEPVFAPDKEETGLTLLTGANFSGIRSEALPIEAITAPPVPGAPATEAAPAVPAPEAAPPIGIMPDRGVQQGCS